jgi:adenosine deaminase
MKRLGFDLHRHLEGSIRPETLLQIAAEFRVPRVSDDLETFRRFVAMADEDPRTFRVFLSKFNGLRTFWVDRRAIEWAARSAVEDAAGEGVRHLELRFHPAFFCAAGGFASGDAAAWIVQAAGEAARQNRMRISFVASLVRHLAPSINRPLLDMALEGGLFQGLDLGGDEMLADGLEYAPGFRKAAERGLGITVHAGEQWGGERRIEEAIDRFGARRIGHGTCAFRIPRLLDRCVEAGVVFEVCLSSNRWTGQTPGTHPAAGALRAEIVLGTDNPAIFGTNLGQETSQAAELGFHASKLSRSAAKAAFRPA